MRVVLIITVGGTHQPILASIRQNRPEFVYFLCSDDSSTGPGSYAQVIGPGKVLKSRPDIQSPDWPNIVTLTALRDDQYEVHRIKNLDDLDDCYLTSLRLIERVHSESRDATIIADYTGGTK